MKNETSICPLQECAQSIINEMGNPSDLLLFLSEATSWAHNYEMAHGKTNECTPHFLTRQLVDHVAAQWVKTGDPVKNISTGLIEIYEFGGAEEYVQGFSHLLAAYGESIPGSGYPGEDWQRILSNGINVLSKIGVAFVKYGTRPASKEAA